MKLKIIALCISLFSLSSSSAEDAKITLSKWTSPEHFTVTSEVVLAGQTMQMSVGYMTCNTTASVVSQIKEKQTFQLAVDDSTLKALKALTPELKDFDPYFGVELKDSVLSNKTIELAAGEGKSILVRVGIHESAYGKLNAEKQKAFEDLCRNAKLMISKKGK